MCEGQSLHARQHLALFRWVHPQVRACAGLDSRGAANTYREFVQPPIPPPSAIGEAYGSSGGGTFSLPDLRDRAPAHAHPLGGLRLGERAGRANVELKTDNLPPHSHSSSANLRTEALQGIVSSGVINVETAIDVSHMSTNPTEARVEAQSCTVTDGRLSDFDSALDLDVSTSLPLLAKDDGVRQEYGCSQADKRACVTVLRHTLVPRAAARLVPLTSKASGKVRSLRATTTGSQAKCAPDTVKIPAAKLNGEARARTTGQAKITGHIPSLPVLGSVDIGLAGRGRPVSLQPPVLGIKYIICLGGPAGPDAGPAPLDAPAKPAPVKSNGKPTVSKRPGPTLTTSSTSSPPVADDALVDLTAAGEPEAPVPLSGAVPKWTPLPADPAPAEGSVPLTADATPVAGADLRRAYAAKARTGAKPDTSPTAPQQDKATSPPSALGIGPGSTAEGESILAGEPSSDGADPQSAGASDDGEEAALSGLEPVAADAAAQLDTSQTADEGSNGSSAGSAPGVDSVPTADGAPVTGNDTPAAGAYPELDGLAGEE
jgi:microcystin-dependent protein